MGRQAKAGQCLKRLVIMAVPVLQAAERQCPRKGRGAKLKIPDWLIAALIMYSVLKKKKTKSAQYRFLRQQRSEIATWLGRPAFSFASHLFSPLPPRPSVLSRGGSPSGPTSHRR